MSAPPKGAVVQPRSLGRTLRRLEPTGWVAAARQFGTTLRTAGHRPGRLLVIGVADAEPWHLTAHLAEAARRDRCPELDPVLVRWQVPAGAPAHLAVGLEALRREVRGATVLVATPSDADEQLLERLDDARRSGATLLALHPGAGPLDDLAHACLALPDRNLMSRGDGFETAVHMLGATPAPPWSVPAPRRRLLLGRGA